MGATLDIGRDDGDVQNVATKKKGILFLSCLSFKIDNFCSRENDDTILVFRLFQKSFRQEKELLFIIKNRWIFRPIVVQILDRNYHQNHYQDQI